jgi:hypothetical protein
MKTTIGDLRHLVREAVDSDEAEKAYEEKRVAMRALTDALMKIEALTDGNSEIMMAAFKAWHKSASRGGSDMSTRVRASLFSDRGPVFGLSDGGFDVWDLKGFIIDVLRPLYSDKKTAEEALDTAEWLSGPIVDEIAAIKAGLGNLKGGEDPSAPLGRFAFATGRAAGARVPWEPNTKDESELLARINAYFAQNINIPPEAAAELLDLYQQGLYADILRGPDVEIVYRGMGAGSKWLRKLLGLRAKDPIPPNGTAEVKATYRSSEGAAISWSADRDMAVKFAKQAFKNRGDTGAEYTLLLTARVSDNPKVFLAGPGGLYKLKVPSGYKQESEVLALGPVKLYGVEWRSIAAAEAEYNAKKAAEKAAKKKGKKT